MYTSAYLGAQFIKTNYPEVKNVRYIGMNAVRQELEDAGFKTSGGQDNRPFENDPITIDSFNNFPMDKDVGALLVGLD